MITLEVHTNKCRHLTLYTRRLIDKQQNRCRHTIQMDCHLLAYCLAAQSLVALLQQLKTRGDLLLEIMSIDIRQEEIHNRRAMHLLPLLQ